MDCPYCRKAIHADVRVVHLGFDDSSNWAALTRQCPACKGLIVGLMRVNTQDPYEDDPSWYGISEETMVMPRVPERDPTPPEVPPEFATDYEEACRVLIDSPQASAALSRRCLQHILRERAGVEGDNLFDEIEKVTESGDLPSHLADALQDIRVAGNLAAHPMKSGRTTEIVKVEHGEAERCLAVTRRSSTSTSSDRSGTRGREKHSAGSSRRRRCRAKRATTFRTRGAGTPMTTVRSDG